MLTPLARTTALLAAGLLAAAASAGEPVPTCPRPAATRCPDPARGKMVLVPYQVAELVVPIANSGKKGETGKTCEDRLIRTIQDTISPKTWASHGGYGTIDYFPMTMSLVVNQTPDVQEQIADLLSKLRREQDTQVALEVRLVSMPDESFERVGVDFNTSASPHCTPEVRLTGLTPAGPPKPEDLPPATLRLRFLNDQQVFHFLEAIQGDQRTNVMQAPKLTLFNGQTSNLDCTDRQKFVTGLEVVQRDGHPVITPRRKRLLPASA
jgi:general secretion pathway protein D